MIIIGITGTLGAGKGSVSSYLQEKGFVHFSVRSFLIEELKRRGESVNRDSMTPVGNELRKMHGPSYIIEELYKMAQKQARDAVIESVRVTAEVDFLKKNAAILLAVDADPKLRYERIQERKSALDDVSYEKFLAHEKREMDSADPNHQNIRECIRRADFVLMNNGTIEELHAQIDKILPK